MYRATYALCGDREVAMDSTQEAFARALSRWRRLRGERWAAGWVMTTALNVTRRSLRRRAPLPERAVVHDADLDVVLDLRTRIRALPRRQQAAVVLYYLAGLPVAEVAGAMGCREGTVRAHLARARASLAHELGDPGRRPGPVPAQEKGDADA